MPEAHFHALFGGFVNQDFVKHFAAHLEHRARPGGEFVGEIKRGAAAAPCECRAVFKLKAFFGAHSIGKTCFFQHFHAVRQQALANHKARKMLFFQHAYFEALFVQQGGGNRAGWACADDGNIKLGGGHIENPFVVNGFDIKALL